MRKQVTMSSVTVATRDNCPQPLLTHWAQCGAMFLVPCGPQSSPIVIAMYKRFEEGTTAIA